jgi:hypothetical protein
VSVIEERKHLRKKLKIHCHSRFGCFVIRGGSMGGGGGGGRTRRAPPKIGKNMIFWRKIVIFHKKYPKYFRASLRSAQFVFKWAPPPLTWNPESVPGNIPILTGVNDTFYSFCFYCIQKTRILCPSLGSINISFCK